MEGSHKPVTVGKISPHILSDYLFISPENFPSIVRNLSFPPHASFASNSFAKPGDLSHCQSVVHAYLPTGTYGVQYGFYADPLEPARVVAACCSRDVYHINVVRNGVVVWASFSSVTRSLRFHAGAAGDRLPERRSVPSSTHEFAVRTRSHQ